VALALQQLPPSPGQGTTAPASSPAGEARPTEPGSLGMLLPLILFVPLIVVMFWSSRSQQKRQQKMLGELQKGDWVLTQSGLRGKLVELGDRFAKVEISPGVKVDVLRGSLLGKDSVETASQLEKK
jgi:preprotein translocase subunit YajC